MTTVHLPAKRSISFTVPLVPPSVNHYVKHTRSGRHYVTKEAKAFKTAVSIFARDKGQFHGGIYEVNSRIFLGRNQRRDVDNCGKVLLDALCESGVIDSDSRVNRCVFEKARDWQNPRTEITVTAL